MNLVGLLVLLVLLFRLFLNAFNEGSNRRHRVENTFCWISYIAIVLLAAFRGITVGADTAYYLNDYLDVASMSFSEIADRFEGYLGYYFLSKLFSLAGFPHYVWFGFLEAVFLSAISRFINKYSSDRLYSIILFLVTGLFAFSLAGLKQTLAMTLLLHGFLCFVERRYTISVILVVLTYFTHPGALPALILFFLYFIKDKKYFSVVVIAGILLIWLGDLLLVSTFVSLSGNEHYELYLEENSSYSMSTLILYILMILCTVPYLKRYLKTSGFAKVEFSGSLFVCAFQYLASYSPSLFRLALVFIPFLIVYVPNSFEASRKNANNSTWLLKTLALLGPIVFYLYASRDFVYVFQWPF